MLTDQGHEVRIFAMRHPENLPCPDSRFFVQYRDFKNLRWWQIPAEFFRSIYRRESKFKLQRLLINFRPDVAHLNNINFQLTTSIIDVLNKYSIPIITTAHDYQLVCPNHLLYVHHNVCRKCLNGKFYYCLLNRCYNRSWGFSLLAMLESYFNKQRRIYQKIDRLIAPSEYLKQHLMAGGLAANKIQVLSNPVPVISVEPSLAKPKENYFLYFGRLTEEKGIGDLIDFFTKHPRWSLKIAGQGPLAEKISCLGLKNIDYLGFCPKTKIHQLIIKARAVIIPSNWPENCPYSALEAISLGTPVIAKNRGGLSEIIKPGENGFLYNNDEELAKILTESAVNQISQRQPAIDYLMTEQQYLEQITNLYRELIINKGFHAEQ